MISINNLTVWYDKGNNIIENADILLKEKSIIGLLGVNGAGKTTLLNVLSGIHKKYLCQSLKRKGCEDVFSSLTFKKERYTVFTNDQAFEYWSFRNYLKFVHNVYKKEPDDNYIQYLIKGFKFEKYADYLIKDLSTGNKKKVFLIAGFALKLDLLLLDEPLDGLDFEASEFLYEVILDYKNYGTVLMSSHIAESFEKTCEGILFLNQKKIDFKELKQGSNIRSELEGWLDERN